MKINGFGWQGAALVLILVPIYWLSFADFGALNGQVNLYLGSCNGEQKKGCILSEVRKVVFKVDKIKQKVNGESCTVRDRLNWTCRRELGETNAAGDSPYYDFGFVNGAYTVESVGLKVPDELSDAVVVAKTDWIRYKCGKVPLLLCAPVVGLM